MLKNHICKLALNNHQLNGELQIFVSDLDEYLGQLIIIAEVNAAGESNKK